MQMLDFKHDWMLEIAWQVPREPSPVNRPPYTVFDHFKNEGALRHLVACS